MAYYPKTNNRTPAYQGLIMGGNNEHEQQSLYGSFNKRPTWETKSGRFAQFLARPQETFKSALVCLIVPWLLYCTMYWLMSFRVHYEYPVVCWSLVLLGLLFVAALAKLAVDATAFRNGPSYQASHWYSLLALLSFIAFIIGVMCGDTNFFYNTNAFYNVVHLADYGFPPVEPVDPSRITGKQVMDAGQIKFADHVYVNRSMTMVFKNQDNYCVAPIMTNHTLLPNVSYDFWAVGLNCCTGMKADFQCGEFNNPHAHSGLRLLRDDQREYYRLAVQQAQAAFKITASHPLFFFWLENPVAELDGYQKDGYNFFTMGVIVYFFFQCLSVMIAVVVFQKLGYV
mmetsp:Transcript_73083/g.127829  ORF Transcript_73083/g.127829 Transcript_73083/m.127829 type:complete len:341 (+) Transcript_73083:119-1141(+)